MPTRSSIPFSVAIVLVAGSARAVPEYPSEIEQHLGLAYAVPCSLCHEKGNTGSGTVVTPFAWSMRGQGLNGDDRLSVAKALDALEAAHTDSDGDEVDDVDELIAGTDPNGAGSVPIPNGAEPGYGCGGTAPTGHRGAALIPLPLLALVARSLRRRGRNRK